METEVWVAQSHIRKVWRSLTFPMYHGCPRLSTIPRRSHGIPTTAASHAESVRRPRRLSWVREEMKRKRNQPAAHNMLKSRCTNADVLKIWTSHTFSHHNSSDRPPRSCHRVSAPSSSRTDSQFVRLTRPTPVASNSANAMSASLFTSQQAFVFSLPASPRHQKVWRGLLLGHHSGRHQLPATCL